ncbi:MAG: AAA family ATPase, partial [Desulfobacteraceae bacterium]|nr:AAA family ATPase [Desulfobacteraceae bacterium]
MVREFPGYQILEQLGETPHSVVYRAQTQDHSRTVVLKALNNGAPSAAEIARFRHEYTLISAIDIQGIIRVLDIIDGDGRLALVLEDFGGVALKQVLTQGFTLERFLDLAIRLAQILGQLHQSNIFHRDVNPFNILLNPDSDVLKIADFGISSQMSELGRSVSHPALVEGTLAYISPEQTGRMNCGVDYRTDLYSLGVTFYEMLTGTVPFQSKDPLEIIHAHIAKMPPPPREFKREIPAAVSDIVMKLLAKSAAERYQNGFGLAADLRECRRQWQTTGRITPFTLGTKDISLRFIIPNHLVGRDEELAVLHAAFERASQGAAEIVLVSGEPGIGKSALVHELYKPIAAKRGYFIAGKFDRFHRAVPYSAIIQAFQGLVRQLLAESDTKLQQWRRKLLAALGPNGKVITDVIPEVALIIGNQPDLTELGPEETQNRFHLFFKNFVRVFAADDHPLVLFLDDLQWADIASFTLIQTLATDRHLRHVFYIGAYRDTDAASHHLFTQIRDTIQAARVPIHTIRLGPLNSAQINQFITVLLSCTAETAQPLAQAIHAKTKGSPFFIHQFLKTLYDQKHLRIDPVAGWTWDLEKIRELEATENVVAFMAAKLHDLPGDIQETIKVCACIGNRFDLETLALITGRAMNKLLAGIDRLTQDGLIHRAGNLYRFSHDRIQEAAYSLLDPEERQGIHYRIGNLDVERTPAETRFNRIFYMCDQLNLAGARVAGPSERTRLAQLNLEAGIKAKESAAYAAAVNYLVKGSALLNKDAWRADYELTYALYIELMECRYLNRDFGEAERLFEIIIANCANRRDQARAYYVLIVLYTTLRSPAEAVALGLKALSLFGINISAEVGVPGVLMELLPLMRRLKKIGLSSMADLPVIEDADLNACLDIVFALGTPAYYFNPHLFAKLVLKALNMTLKRRSTMRYAASGLIALATIMQTVFGNYTLGYRLGEMAIKINERFDDRKVAGVVHHIFAFFLHHWQHHARRDLDIYRKAYQLSINAGDFMYAGHSINAAIDCRLSIGEPLDDILAENEKYLDLMKVVKDPFIAARHRENTQLIFNLKGETPSSETLTGPGYDEALHIAKLKEEKNFFGLSYTLLYKVKILYLQGALKQARGVAVELRQYIKSQLGTLQSAEYYFYDALVGTALILDFGAKGHGGVIRRNLRKLRRLARLCPANFQHKYDLVRAEDMAIKKQHREALRCYHEAIEGARKNGYLHEEAIACERLAQFYQAGGITGEAAAYRQRAHRCYATWGATAKVNMLRTSFPELTGTEKHAAALSQEGSTVSHTTDNLDLSTVMQVSQVISKEIKLDRLLQKTMHMCMANAGAQYGFLIMESDGRLLVQASETVDTGNKQVLQATPLDACADLSPAIVNYVLHSGEPLILGNAVQEGDFINDPHVRQRQCKSILCMPISNHGRLKCLLYLENNLTADAFTPERLEIL